LVRKTRREKKRLGAPYQRFHRRNFKSTCMKLGGRKKWIPFSLG